MKRPLLALAILGLTALSATGALAAAPLPPPPDCPWQWPPPEDFGPLRCPSTGPTVPVPTPAEPILY